ncbi:rhodanese-like domain-containing protein [Neolewinella litorea]|uniref:Rhodanese-like domain-containing protein n=2 Tax=Neolewinella litorea TaxID=2562452 RepID=A0A4S4NAU2_9BACT|nr:rhodanese-like domain-containing protein [Neolewinella litorea]
MLLAVALLACGPETDTATTPPPSAAENAVAPVAPAPAPAHENLSPAEFAEKMKGENVVVLDVRTPGEIRDGKIDGALELDFRDPQFATKLAELDRDPTYLVYCAVGGRSNQACELMTEAGFQKVYNLDGGYTAWAGR